ncbi:MAG: FAD-binding oxidoreductase [Desulfurivibrionaceae bacterium]
MDHRTTILMTEFVTHDTKRFIVSRPDNLQYEPGQGVEIAVDQEDWRQEGRPFTPTSLTDDKVLEFTIKRYPEHEGVTARLHNLGPGADLLMSEPFGTITYKGAGVFIAAGAGITPFLAIFRKLNAENALRGNQLIFSNKTAADIICEKELRHYFVDKCVFTSTRETKPGYDNRHVDRNFLEEKIDTFNQYFYVCGPDEFVENVNEILREAGADPQSLVFEEG